MNQESVLYCNMIMAFFQNQSMCMSRSDEIFGIKISNMSPTRYCLKSYLPRGNSLLHFLIMEYDLNKYGLIKCMDSVRITLKTVDIITQPILMQKAI